MYQFTPEPGAPVLCPLPATKVVEVISYYDGPLEVLLDIDGSSILATCQHGALEDSQVWTYRWLTPSTSQVFPTEAPTGPAIHEWLEARYTLAPITVVATQKYDTIVAMKRVVSLGKLPDAISQLAATFCQG